eukprot:TRINITY_DN27145_c0_g1_i1.p1 TRINITY_DN27145_c0_g1~~TRINITY_DN27145_c0_g1_i1.p1  ORF type:complete len:661 (+),score=215.39 TRINITY_DN27145_c0_g1_i1:48-2030(+)
MADEGLGSAQPTPAAASDAPTPAAVSSSDAAAGQDSGAKAAPPLADRVYPELTDAALRPVYRDAFVGRPVGNKTVIMGLIMVVEPPAVPDARFYWVPLRSVVSGCPAMLSEEEVQRFVELGRGAKAVKNEHMYMQRERLVDVLSAKASDKRVCVTFWKDAQFVESIEFVFLKKDAAVDYCRAVARGAGLVKGLKGQVWERKNTPVSQNEHADWLYSDGGGKRGLRLPGMVWGTGKKLLDVLGTVGATVGAELGIKPSGRSDPGTPDAASPPAHLDPGRGKSPTPSDAAVDDDAGDDAGSEAQVGGGELGVEDDCGWTSETPDDFPTCPSFEVPCIPEMEHRNPVHADDELLTALDLDELKEQIFVGGAGCSDECRRAIWMRLLGLTALDADDIAAEYATYKAQYDGVTQCQRRYYAWLAQQEGAIEKDLHRTDRDVGFFEDMDGDGMAMLRNVLHAYIMFNRDLGYVQGMSDVAAVACYVMQDEATAFCCFQELMERIVPVMNDNAAEERAAMQKVLRVISAEAAAHLASLDPEAMFCFRWLWLRFKREFPFNDVLRLWDVLLAAPVQRYHLVVAASILGRLSAPILKFTCMSHAVRFCQSLCGNVPVSDALAVSETNWSSVLRTIPPVVELLNGPIQKKSQARATSVPADESPLLPVAD